MRARRPRRRAGRQALAGAGALPRVPARRPRLPAAQHRLPEVRARSSSSATRQPRVIVCRPEALGMVATLAGDATVLTIDAHGGELRDRAAASRATFDDRAVARPTISRRSCTRRGPPAARRARCSRTATSRRNALALVEAWGFTRGDVLLHALPIYHVHGLFVAVHCALLSGARLLWLPKFDAQEVHRVAAARDRDDGRADVLHAAPRRAGVHARRLPQRRGCSFPARHRCCRRRSTRFARAPGTRSSSATA